MSDHMADGRSTAGPEPLSELRRCETSWPADMQKSSEAQSLAAVHATAGATAVATVNCMARGGPQHGWLGVLGPPLAMPLVFGLIRDQSALCGARVHKSATGSA